MVGAVSASGIALRTFRFAPSPHAPRLSGVVNPFHGRRGVRKRYCPSDLPLRSIPPRLAARCPPLTAAGGQGPQDNTACDHAIRRFPSSPRWRAHRPLTAAGGQGPQDNTACDPAHIHSCRLLPARSTRKLSISTIPPCACQDCPPANSSLSYPTSLRLRVQLIYLPA